MCNVCILLCMYVHLHTHACIHAVHEHTHTQSTHTARTHTHTSTHMCCYVYVPVRISHAHDIVLIVAIIKELFNATFLLYRLVIGLTCGLVIVDTVECKCLLVEVNEFDFIG